MACRHCYGPLPLILRTWFDIVGQLDLRGDHPKLSRYHSNGPASDPLVVWFDSYAGENDEDEDDEDGDENHEAGIASMSALFSFDIAPDACHKSNYSGGGPLHIKCPNPSFDAPLISDDAWNRMYFVPYLRVCFQWGGFPGLQFDENAAQHAHKELAFLTEGFVLF